MQPTMSQPASTPAMPVARLIVWTIATVIGMLMVAAAALWVHYGTAVFLEMVLTGIASCF